MSLSGKLRPTETPTRGIPRLQPWVDVKRACVENMPAYYCCCNNIVIGESFHPTAKNTETTGACSQAQSSLGNTDTEVV